MQVYNPRDFLRIDFMTRLRKTMAILLSEARLVQREGAVFTPSSTLNSLFEYVDDLLVEDMSRPLLEHQREAVDFAQELACFVRDLQGMRLRIVTDKQLTKDEKKEGMEEVEKELMEKERRDKELNDQIEKKAKELREQIEKKLRDERKWEEERYGRDEKAQELTKRSERDEKAHELAKQKQRQLMKQKNITLAMLKEQKMKKQLEEKERKDKQWREQMFNPVRDRGLPSILKKSNGIARESIGIGGFDPPPSVPNLLEDHLYRPYDDVEEEKDKELNDRIERKAKELREQLESAMRTESSCEGNDDAPMPVDPGTISILKGVAKEEDLDRPTTSAKKLAHPIIYEPPTSISSRKPPTAAATAVIMEQQPLELSKLTDESDEVVRRQLKQMDHVVDDVASGNDRPPSSYCLKAAMGRGTKRPHRATSSFTFPILVESKDSKKEPVQPVPSPSSRFAIVRETARKPIRVNASVDTVQRVVVNTKPDDYMCSVPVVPRYAGGLKPLNSGRPPAFHYTLCVDSKATVEPEKNIRFIRGKRMIQSNNLMPASIDSTSTDVSQEMLQSDHPMADHAEYIKPASTDMSEESEKTIATSMPAISSMSFGVSKMIVHSGKMMMRCHYSDCDYIYERRLTSNEPIRNEHIESAHSRPYWMHWMRYGRLKLMAGTMCPFCNFAVEKVALLCDHLFDCHPTHVDNHLKIYSCSTCKVYCTRIYQVYEHWQKSGCNGQLRVESSSDPSILQI